MQHPEFGDAESPEPGDSPLFAPGDLVRHRRYHYRGVVVDWDPECQASEEWYSSNKTQPKRDQPWYHVLVDGGTTVTYPAESSLMRDDSGEPIVHPFLEHFFDGFENGRYLRNDREWPRE